MNTRFAVAVHILTFLQTQQGEPAPSETSGEAPASIIEQAPEPLSEESHTQLQEVAPLAEAEATAERLNGEAA